MGRLTPKHQSISDGSIIILTTGNLIDRRGHEYNELGKGITPDIQVSGTTLGDYIRAIKSK
ncbi:MAG: hypothetical protein EOO88_32625 [Pedobacter sp.]|nr:MAG: hypothetical protein EOO88_32625 [Pedobacter sp.]